VAGVIEQGLIPYRAKGNALESLVAMPRHHHAWKALAVDLERFFLDPG
jgi:hypothetical protein